MSLERIPLFIDLYHEDADPQFGQLARCGVLGCALKATEDVGFTDPTYQARRLRALEVWPQGTLSYHMLGRSPVHLQMKHYLAVTAGQRGRVLDWEKTVCSLAMCVEAVHMLFEETGRWPVVYAPEGLMTNALLDGHFQGIPLWIANPSHEPNVPFSLWQYGAPDWGSGEIPGYDFGRMDVSTFHGSPDQLRGWLKARTS